MAPNSVSGVFKRKRSELVSDLLRAAPTLLLDPFISLRHLGDVVSLQHLKQAVALGPLTFSLIALLSQLMNVSFVCTFFLSKILARRNSLKIYHI